jgi:hypothetical protein
MRPGEDLSGVWHGLYSYDVGIAPVYFVATLIQSGSNLSGLTHEQEKGENGAPLTLFASIDGTCSPTLVRFTKHYDGSGGWDHAVAYNGQVQGDGNEIEGLWQVEHVTGRFLMIRRPGTSESVVRKAYEKA